MANVYVLLHDQEDYPEDCAKWVGVYSSEERAEQALERLRSKPGFREHPEDWLICPWQIDSEKGEWSEGYVTIYPGEYLPRDEEQ